MSASILKKTYFEKAVPNLKESLGFKSNMAVPKITKVTLNMGLGPDAVNDRKVIDTAIEDLRLISGQQPVKTLVRKSVASFKIRDGYPIGCKVTLRGERMYDFLDRLLNIAIPRERDFRGLSVKSFDGQGNYTMGIKEHIIFPEIDYDKVQKIRGMDISITTSARNDEEGLSLLKELNFPFVS
jgi:large subunit ribosomal protein L5